MKHARMFRFIVALLFAALAIRSLDERDAALRSLAATAAAAGEAKVTLTAISEIRVLDVRDRTAADAALRLARGDSTKAAREIALMIRQLDLRDQTLGQRVGHQEIRLLKDGLGEREFRRRSRVIVPGNGEADMIETSAANERKIGGGVARTPSWPGGASRSFPRILETPDMWSASQVFGRLSPFGFQGFYGARRGRRGRAWSGTFHEVEGRYWSEARLAS